MEEKETLCTFIVEKGDDIQISTLTKDDVTEFFDSQKEEWFKNNSHKSQLLGNMLFAYVPNIGYKIQVERLEIPQHFFEEEYKQITEAYFSVLKKLDEHYKNNMKNV